LFAAEGVDVVLAGFIPAPVEKALEEREATFLPMEVEGVNFVVAAILPGEGGTLLLFPTLAASFSAKEKENRHR
jgi:hypothetical protein